ncbi:hypothetical protein BU16DRAFT_470125 [Lophium mytilinum]|uniref:Uncharacterized protein n=1 Tax=Lophium mytilinum TaxID=390894 RepID=A0A6A6QFE1_9PEZI|nr:hypothetical protein BU16DRAFT_470125 [Lophium mytilinum]
MSPHANDTPAFEAFESNGANGGGNAEALNDFPIAIIGMACRFPQDAVNTEKFWDLLINGRSAMTEFPPEKMTTEAHYHPDPAHAGTTSCRGGYFMKHNGAAFDAPFFNITKNEALTMDTQQRLLMENVYESLENAGIPLDKVIGSNTSVYVGAFSIDCSDIFTADHEAIMKYSATGNSLAILSNRISYFYDLKGTSISVDTACSSSMVAFHLACQDLRNGNSEMSIVGGANILENPDKMYRMSNNGFLSPDSKCYSFDSRANGYSRGEGIGSLILKPLHTAIRDGDVIRAVVRSTGLNQDGRTPGMTLPSKNAQETLIRKVYANAGLDLRDTEFIEAHGTGTAAGDPIEASAIAAAWSGRNGENPLYIGAAKANIGHLEGSSGVAGLIKTVMVLEKAIIPPNINFEKVNPKILPEKWGIAFPTKPMPWPSEGPRRASINSFGFGGTNAHAVLDDAYNYLNNRGLRGSHCSVSKPPTLAEIMEGVAKEEAPAEVTNGDSNGNSNGISDSISNGITNGDSNGLSNGHANGHSNGHSNGVSNGTSRVFVLSASDEAGIKRAAEGLSTYLASIPPPKNEESYLDSLAYTLSEKRTLFSWKTFVVANSLEDLIQQLNEGLKAPKRTRAREVPTLGFVFTGQGAQWHAMGRELLSYPIFRRSVQDASDYLRSLGSVSNMMDELLKDKESSNIGHPVLSQTLCTVLQVALVDLLNAWNIAPTRVIGHSSGEIGAAYCVGALSRESAWRIAYSRGVVSASLMGGKGAMMAVGMTEDALEPFLEQVDSELSGELVKACYNSPSNITVSGDEAKIDLLKTKLDAENVFARKLAVKNAYHSGHMKAVADEYLRLIGTIEKGSAAVGKKPQMFSTVIGQQIPVLKLSNPQYWVDNMVSPVRFTQTLEAMCSNTGGKSKLRAERGADIAIQHLVEIGPHSAMQSAIRDTMLLQTIFSSIGYSTVLTRNVSAVTTSLQAAGSLLCLNYPVDLNALNYASRIPFTKNHLHPQMLVDLPPYKFNYSRTYWPETRISKNFRFRKHPRHDLLGAPVTDWDQDEPKWRQHIRVSEIPWVKDHKVTSSNVYPGMGYVVMAIEAMKQLAGPDANISGYRLRDVNIKAALQVPETEEGVEVAFSMRHVTESSLAGSVGWWEFRVSSYNPNTDGWNEHCRGMVSAEPATETGQVDGGREAALEAESQKQMLAEAIERCSAPFDMSRAYSELFGIGLAYGPTFRNLSNVWRGGEAKEARGTITIPDVKAVMPKHYQMPHIIHPGTLDSMLHIFLAAIQDEGAGLSEPMVPVFVRELWVSADLSKEPNQTFNCHGTVKKTGHSKIESTVRAWDEHTNTVKVLIKDIQATPLQNNSTGGGDRDLSWNVETKPDIDLLSSEQSLAYFKKISKKPRLDDAAMTKLSHDLNLASTIYIVDGLKEVSKTTLEGLPDHNQKYLEWLHHMEERYQKGTISHQTPEWESLINDPVRKEQFLQEHCFQEDSSAEFKLIARVGAAIPGILRQEADALQLMFGDDLLDHYYGELDGNVIIQDTLRAYLSTLSHKYVNLKVIEIGSGTGGTTLPVIEALSPVGKDGNMTKNSRLSQFTYTDISAGFFDKAKTKFKAWKNIMEFRRLDIEKDPVGQGFEAGTYDIVLAANVLHATQDLTTTLTNARKLLRPGGKLLLHEGIGLELLSVPLAFGALSGWWLSVEPYRRWGPLVDEKHWDQAFKAADFTGTDLILPDYQDDLIHSQSLMIASAVDPTPAERQSPDTIVLTTEAQSKSSLVSSVVESLEKFGLPSVKVVDWRHLADIEVKESTFVSLLDLDHPVLLDVSESDFANLKKLFLTSQGGLWVGKSAIAHPDAAIATGFIRTARWERDLDTCDLVTLGLEDSELHSDAQTAKHISKIFDHHFITTTTNKNEEYSTSEGLLSVPRLIQAEYINSFLASKVTKAEPEVQAFGADPTRALRLSTDAPGLLNRLMFIDDPVYPKPLQAEDVEVEIKATGLNFRDIMSAMGEVNGEVLGAEGAGFITRVGSNVTKVKKGDRVMIMADQTGCFNTYARCDQRCVSQIPDDMSFETAASIPVIYCTVLYCLNDIGRLLKGETILIHAAAGGVGQAAIMVAQDRGAEIFCTVSTHEKRDILINTYGIPEDHIFSSRDLSFVKGIMRMTNGKGVNVVLNSLAGEALRRTWDCIAYFGRFLEIGKRDILSNGRLEMFQFSKSVMFASCDLETVIKLDKPLSERLLEDTVALWNKKVIGVTTPFTTYNFGELESSFRLLQSGKHIGKVVLTSDPSHKVQALPKQRTAHKFCRESSYVLAGGLGGLGRSMALWMVSQGARNIIFLSRSGAASDEAKKTVKELEELGCKVRAFACDINSKTALESTLAQCVRDMPPIGGCVQGAMQLRDSSLELMTVDQYNQAVNPKVHGSRNLHEALPHDLTFFIMLSSCCGIIGNRGQANYAAGNTYQDALAHHRRSKGLAATTLDLGAMLGVGYIAENQDKAAGSQLGNLAFASDAIREDEFHALLEYHMDARNSLREDLEKTQVAIGLGSSASYKWKGMPEPGFMKYPLFTQLHVMSESTSNEGEEDSSLNTKANLRAAKSFEEATTTIVDAVVRKLSSVMSLPVEDFDPSKPIHHYGVDSLVAVEFRNWFSKDLGADIPVLDIMGNDSIAQLAVKISKTSKLVKIAEETD